jgi:hypothetical protein
MQHQLVLPIVPMATADLPAAVKSALPLAQLPAAAQATDRPLLVGRKICLNTFWRNEIEHKLRKLFLH